MAQLNIRVDDDTKKLAEEAFQEMGISMSAGINIYLRKVAREKRIPFEVNADPFYSKENIERLTRAISDIEKGISLKQHDLMEVEDD